MTGDIVKAGIDRRTLVKGGLGLAGAGALGGALFRPRPAGARYLAPDPAAAAYRNSNPTRQLHLTASDGWVSMPGADTDSRPPYWPDSLAPDPFDTYIFGFRNLTGLYDPAEGLSPAQIQARVAAQQGKAQTSAPILDFDEGDEVKVDLTNLGLIQRPDLVDGHTIHWHGFQNAVPLFDGVPELSIAVPIGGTFTYYYLPHDPGTYMYHCHFEDVEHVQMGMTGVVYVRPRQNDGDQVDGNSLTIPAGKYAYNDGVQPGDPGSTAYDREFTFMITEMWVEAHYRDAHVQLSDWTNFQPSFWLLNGRAYPDTLADNGHLDIGSGEMVTGATGRAGLAYQPNSSLIEANEGERVLLRLANLGFQLHTMTLEGIPMTIVAKDARLLVGADGTPLAYQTNGVDVGAGESRDAIFTAPAFSGGAGTSGGGFDRYVFYDRNLGYLNNNGKPGAGGQRTEVRVYPDGFLDAQNKANELHGTTGVV